MRWVKSFLVATIVFIALSVYLYLRRGYYNFYIINKVFGSTAAILAGLTLIIGPLSRKVQSLTTFVTIRRQLGLLAFGFAILHIAASLLQQNRFVFPSWYLDEWVPVLFGLLAITGWAYMSYISRNEKIKQMGADVWKKQLRLAGDFAFLAIFLHLTLMKYPGWIRYLDGQVRQTPELANPEYPPASLFIFLFMLPIIFYRVFGMITRKRR